MSYLCVDMGSEKCPCVLMESGQCYTCNMIRKEKCDCSSLWQGVCPYGEYLQRNKRSVGEMAVRKFKVCNIASYSPTLTVITLETPIGYGIKCKEIGAFVMIAWKSWFLPISVLQVKMDYESQVAYVKIAVNAVGAKTIGLLKEAMIGCEVQVKGPFYNGVLNRENFSSKNPSIVIAKGISVMPLINIKELIQKNLISFKLDVSKLPRRFLDDYFKDIEYEIVDFEKEYFEIAESLSEEFGYAYVTAKPNVFLFASPYYTERILNITSVKKNNILLSNHSNMCCGEGYCGSCSTVDEKGITVRKCKCNNL